MCIISCVPSGTYLRDDVVKEMWDCNSDGAGFMYAEKGKLYVKKGFMTFDSFLDAYKPHEGKAMVLHFRIRTHGETNAENTHPFLVDENLAFVHNGTITGFGSKSHSDTWHFNEEIVKGIRERIPSFLTCDPIIHLIKERVGWSKLAFMDNTGEITIINKEGGEESSDGIWFSNGSWRSVRPSRSYKFNDETPRGNSVVPFKSANARTFDALEAGDFCVVDTDYTAKDLGIGGEYQAAPVRYKLTPEDPLQVLYFNQDNSVVVQGVHSKKHFSLTSSLWLSGITRTAKIIRPWGHLHVGTEVLVVGFDDKLTRIIDTNLSRAYDVPSRVVQISAE